MRLSKDNPEQVKEALYDLGSSVCFVAAKCIEELQKQIPKEGFWITRNNPNYSPFDGSSEKISVCPVCGYESDRKIPHHFCPNCGSKLRFNTVLFLKDDLKHQ